MRLGRLSSPERSGLLFGRVLLFRFRSRSSGFRVGLSRSGVAIRIGSTGYGVDWAKSGATK